MARIRNGIVLLIFLFGIETCLSQIHRSSFPEGFVFGTSSSAFQYEGAVKDDGRGPTIWDTFSHSFGRIKDFSHADVTVDHYNRYPEDIQYLQDMGMDVFRFSISWSRIFPNGTGEVNQAGVDHYNKVIDTLLAKGIEPYVTLFHWDLPQTLEDRYKGWLDPQIIKDFAIYAETCFEKFGDRVKHWITINEPHTFAVQGYASGKFAPGRCTRNIFRPFCSGGNSSTEPYIVGHNLLLAHANVADIYRKKYKPNQHGLVGISFDVIWFEPSSNSPDDIEATQRAQDFQLGWFLDPLMFGSYPSSMISRVGSRLPAFSESDSALLKGSLDFVGINHYTTFYAKHNVTGLPDLIVNITQLPDSDSVAIPFKNGKAIGDKAHSIWLYIVPEGMRSLMNYIKQKYGNPIVIITENGMDDGNSPFISRKTALKDEKRIKYFNDYLTNLLAAIKEDGCNVRGYFAWSLLDNWEWDSGFNSRFGLYYVDYKNLKRYSKNSVQWFKDFLSTQNYKDIQDV